MRLTVAVVRVLYALGAWVIFRHALYTRGAERLPREGPFLLLSNHTSALDPVWCAWAVGRPVGAMASSALFRRPWLGRFLAALGAFPKTKFVKERASMELLTELYQEGWPVMVYPEGTRTWDGEPVAALPGIARLIQRLNARVVFCRCTTGFLVQPRWAPWPRWVPVELEYSAPVTFEGQSEAQILEAVNAGIRCSSTARGRGWRLGLGLAQGLDEYLFACPACFTPEALAPAGRLSDRVRCAACGQTWRVDLDCRLHPLPAGPELRVSEAFARLAAHFRAQGGLDAAAWQERGLVARCASARVCAVGAGRALTTLAEGALELRAEELVVLGADGQPAWRLPLAQVSSVALEANSALYLRTAQDTLRLFPQGSRFKWGWLLRERWIAAHPELRGQALPYL